MLPWAPGLQGRSEAQRLAPGLWEREGQPTSRGDLRLGKSPSRSPGPSPVPSQVGALALTLGMV